jgi:hypothetical protein
MYLHHDIKYIQTIYKIYTPIIYSLVFKRLGRPLPVHCIMCPVIIPRVCRLTGDLDSRLPINTREICGLEIIILSLLLRGDNAFA